MTFSPAETAAGRRLVEMALAEDLGSAGDITSQAVIPADFQGEAVFVARAPGIVAGLPVAALVVRSVDARLLFQPHVTDGAEVKPGTPLATIRGPMRSILAVERTALNFLQRLSGIATLTRKYVQAVAGLKAQILDTRKTTPGWRLLEKYAVRCGGGHNHRLGLFDGILIKDNHLAALKSQGTTLQDSLQAALRQAGRAVPVEIEVDDLDQFASALACNPEIILLDNFELDKLRLAVRLRNEAQSRTLLEASGGVNLSTVRAIAETGVDRISVGALTHSAVALDIALDYGHSQAG
jgi:nicotinate-nucleotide pyrophosphorylase (carboxylating)